MNNVNLKKGFSLLFVESMFVINFNIGGKISVGELFLILYFVLNYKDLSKILYWKKFKSMYVALLLTQMFSELFVSNSFNDSIRGIMVTVVAFLHLSLLLSYACYDKRLLLFGFAGASVPILLDKSVDDVSLDVIESGEAAAFVKMRIAPAVGYLLMSISTSFKRQISLFIFVLSGITLIVLGARSVGMFIIVSGVLGYYLSSGKKFNLRNKIPSIVFSVIILYIGYCYYATEVLEGKITSGNNEQILMMKNPYNPFELLYVGRGEFFIGVQAFIDRFWLGFGAWAKDTTGHYWDMLANMKGIVNGWHGVWLPVHSVWIGWGVYNGVLCFLAGSRILLFTLNRSIFLFKNGLYEKTYMFCVTYCFIAFIFNLLFSPPSHFRYTLPLYMSGLLMFRKKI